MFIIYVFIIVASSFILGVTEATNSSETEKISNMRVIIRLFCIAAIVLSIVMLEKQ